MQRRADVATIVPMPQCAARARKALRHEGDLERRDPCRERRHRRRRGQSLLSRGEPEARVRDLQQPPLDVPVEGRGPLLQPDGRWRPQSERGLVLPGAEGGRQGDQGPRRVLERRQDRLGFLRPGAYLPALKFVKMRVCTRRIVCGTALGGVMRALSSADRKIVLFSATAFFTNLSEAAFGLAQKTLLDS